MINGGVINGTGINDQYGSVTSVSHVLMMPWPVDVSHVLTLTPPPLIAGAGVFLLVGEDASLKRHALLKAGSGAFSTQYPTILYKARRSHTIKWTTRLDKYLHAPITYLQSISHKINYNILQYTKSFKSIVYDLLKYDTVRRSHALLINYSIAVQNSTLYSSTPTINTQNATLYSDLSYAIKGHILSLPTLLGVYSQIKTLYTSTTSVNVQHSSEYSLLGVSPVHTQLSDFYNLQADTVTPPKSILSVKVDGVSLDALNGDVSLSKGDYAWKCELQLKSTEDYARFMRDTEFTVDFIDDSYLFIIDSKTLTRDSMVDVSLIIDGISPMAKYTAPRADAITYTLDEGRSAKNIVQDLIGSVDWQIVDWILPKDKVFAEKVYPLDFASKIVSAAGGVIISNRDGSILVRYQYQTDRNNFWGEPADNVYTDSEDNINVTETISIDSYFNKFRLLDESANYSDRIEFIVEEDNTLKGKIHAYPYPWRTDYTLRHTDGSRVLYYPVGIETREEGGDSGDLVEFTDGVGSVPYPVKSIDEVIWLSDVLGALSFSPHTTEIVTDTDINYGYGLARIKYTTEYYVYDVTAVTDTDVQFIMTDIKE